MAGPGLSASALRKYTLVAVTRYRPLAEVVPVEGDVPPGGGVPPADGPLPTVNAAARDTTSLGPSGEGVVIVMFRGPAGAAGSTLMIAFAVVGDVIVSEVAPTSSPKSM